MNYDGIWEWTFIGIIQISPCNSSKETARAESEEDSSFSTDGHQTTLNEMNKKSRTKKQRTKTDNCKKSQKKHRLGTYSNKKRWRLA